MAVSAKLKEYLDGEGVSYELLRHPEAFTAQEIAGAQHVPGHQVIKSVIIKCDGKLVMTVLSAIHLVDFDKFKAVVGSDDVSLANEKEMGQVFPEYELGAEPPFGKLYGLPLYMDQSLEDTEVAFNAGTHTDMVKMSLADYKRLATPDTVADFSKHI